MQADHAYFAKRMRKIGYNHPLAAEPFLFAAHLVFSIRQDYRMGPPQWVTGQDRVAVKRLPVLPLSAGLQSASFIEVDVTRRERVIHIQRSGYIARDENIPGP